MKIAVIFDASGPMAVREDHLQQLSTACPDAEIRFSEDPAELIEAEFQADLLGHRRQVLLRRLLPL